MKTSKPSSPIARQRVPSLESLPFDCVSVSSHSLSGSSTDTPTRPAALDLAEAEDDIRETVPTPDFLRQMMALRAPSAANLDAPALQRTESIISGGISHPDSPIDADRMMAGSETTAEIDQLQLQSVSSFSVGTPYAVVRSPENIRVNDVQHSESPSTPGTPFRPKHRRTLSVFSANDAPKEQESTSTLQSTRP